MLNCSVNITHLVQKIYMVTNAVKVYTIYEMLPENCVKF